MKFRITSKLHLGAFQVDLPEGAIVEFDGQTVKWGGTSYNAPAVRGAVTAGWLVPEADNVSRYIPKPAGVRVRPAQPGAGNTRDSMEVETTSDEEEVVGNYKDMMDDRRETARQGAVSTPPVRVGSSAVTVSQPDPDPVEIEYGDEGDEVEATPVLAAPRPLPTGGMKVMKGDEDQGGIPVARFGTPAVQSLKLAEGAQASTQISQEMAKLSGGRTAKVQKLAHGRPQTTQITEGTPIDDRPGNTTGDVTETRTGETLEDLLPDAASSGLPPAAKPEFDWDKSGHWRKRVEKALEYADKPKILRQILAVETASVIGHLKSELTRRGIKIPS